MDGPNQQIWIRSNSWRAGDTVNPGGQCETPAPTNLAGLRSAASFGYGAGFGAPWIVVDFGRVFLVIRPCHILFLILIMYEMSLRDYRCHDVCVCSLSV